MSLHVTLLHTTPEKFESAQITGHFELVSEENSVTEISCRRSRWVLFPSTQKRKACVFRFLGFEERFRKAPFSWRISVHGRPNRRNKAAFSWRISVHGTPNRRKKATLRLFVSFVFLVKCLWMMSVKLFSQLIQKLRSRWLRNTWGERSILQLTS